MAFLEVYTCNTSFLLQLLCFLTLFTIIFGSPTLEERPQSTLSQSHDFQNLKRNSAYDYPRRDAWATSSHIGHPPTMSTFGEALTSIFKNADFGDSTVLVVCQDGTAPFATVQEAVDQVPENNTRRTTIYVTSGVYE